VFKSFSLFFYQIFSSQIIPKTRKTCCRTKENLLPLLQESPQAFGIARLSEVRTIQIPNKENQRPVWNKLRRNTVGTCAHSPREKGVAGLSAGSVYTYTFKENGLLVKHCQTQWRT